MRVSNSGIFSVGLNISLHFVAVRKGYVKHVTNSACNNAGRRHHNLLRLSSSDLPRLFNSIVKDGVWEKSYKNKKSEDRRRQANS
ncbi:MAG: hypothetical protein ACRDDA_09165 [Aeromonas sp.]